MSEQKFREKYLKYKNKYLELKQKQIGGFMLADETKDRYLDQITKHLLNYYRFYNNYISLSNPLPSITNIYQEVYQSITAFNTDDYCKIYNYLIPAFLKGKPYKQTFTRKDGSVIAQIDGFPSHINYASLIYTSFLLEYELFTLLHQIIHVNTATQPTRNYLITNFEWCDIKKQCSKTRIYKDSIMMPDIRILIKTFALEFDNYFNLFMNEFINNLNSKIPIGKDLIYKSIVPHEHKDHVVNTYDFIFKDWHTRLQSLGYSDDVIIKELSHTMKQIETQGTQYIAEGTGFFSFIYLLYPGFPKANFGSCITYSLFELYIMSRLHVPSENMNLVLENANTHGIEKVHEYWTHTQTTLRSVLRPPHAISHWSTQFTINGKIIKFRNIYTPVSAILNFKDHRKEMLYALLLPVLDSYNVYIDRNNTKIPQSIIPLLHNFIENRKRKLDDIIRINTLPVAVLPKPLPLISIETIFNEAVNNWENQLPTTDIQSLLVANRLALPNNTIITNINIKNLRGQSLLYVAARAGNIQLVKEILKTGCDINIRNSDNSVPLHGAAYGNLGVITAINLQNNEQNRLDIIKLLLQNGADINLQNNRNELPISNINFTIQHILSEAVRLLKPKILLSKIFDYAINYDVPTKYIDLNSNFDSIIDDYNGNIPIKNFNVYNNRGQSLLYVAARSGNSELVKQLLSIPGININIQNTLPNYPRQDTPLRGAKFGNLRGDDSRYKDITSVPSGSIMNQTEKNRLDIVNLLVFRGGI
jgi:ankyrin repeat protein